MPAKQLRPSLRTPVAGLLLCAIILVLTAWPASSFFSVFHAHRLGSPTNGRTVIWGVGGGYVGYENLAGLPVLTPGWHAYAAPYSIRSKFPASLVELPIFAADEVLIPFWIPLILLLLLALLSWSRQRILRRRDQSGLCLRCGYDLRASEDRCPECGEVI